MSVEAPNRDSNDVHVRAGRVAHVGAIAVPLNLIRTRPDGELENWVEPHKDVIVIVVDPIGICDAAETGRVRSRLRDGYGGGAVHLLSKRARDRAGLARGEAGDISSARERDAV